MKYYIICGERSGDMHAGNLAEAIQKYDPSAIIRAVGGNYLQEAGADIAYHYEDIAIMGFAEVLMQFNKVRKKIRMVKEDIIRYRPDALVLVDFGGFNLRIADFAKKNNVRIFYYITPKVWAWNQKRALKIRKLVDKMYVILPFEKEFYKKYDWEVEYVGNPVFDQIRKYQPTSDFLTKHNLAGNKKVVALLPGSRRQELQKVLPIYRSLLSRFPEVQFVIAGVRSLPQHMYNDFEMNKNVDVIYEQAYDLLSNADAAVVTSGTATLETALFDVPQVVVYKTNSLTYSIAKRLININYISLVNLICDKEVVKELIQNDMTPAKVGDELDQLLFNNGYRHSMLQEYSHIKEILGSQSASETTAELIVKDLQ